jgi:hypothetical protein
MTPGMGKDLKVTGKSACASQVWLCDTELQSEPEFRSCRKIGFNIAPSLPISTRGNQDDASGAGYPLTR